MTYSSETVKKEAQYKLRLMEKQTKYDVVQIQEEDFTEMFNIMSIICALFSIGMQTEYLTIISMVFAVLSDIYTQSKYNTLPILIVIISYYLQRVIYVSK